MMASDLLSLKWNNHKTTFFHLLVKLCLKESHSDTTIICQGKYFPAHKLVLCSCSKFFEEIFEKAQCKHPFIIINDLDPSEFEALMKYMYRGEVNVPQNRLPALIKAAEALNIKGLAIPDDTSQVSDLNKRKRKFCDHTLESNKKRRSPIENLQEASNESYIDQDYNISPHENPNPLNLVCCEETIKTESSEPDSVLTKQVLQNNPLCSEEGINIKDEPVEEICQEDQGRYCDVDHNIIGTKTDSYSSNEPTEPQFVDPYLPGIHSQSLVHHLTQGDCGPSDGRTPPETDLDRGGVGGSQQGFVSALTRFKGEKRTFRCHFCSYISFNRTHTINHMRRHTGEKPFTCPRCFKRFSLKHNLDRHLKAHR